MKYNNVSFNVDEVKKMSEAEFIKHESHHGLSEEQLKEAYAKITAKDGKPGTDKAPEKK